MAIRGGHIVVTSDFDVLGLTIFKTATESVTSSTSLQDDDQLQFTVAANSRYTFEGWLAIDGANTPAGDIKIDFSVPASATCEWSNFGNNVSQVTQYDTTVWPAGTPRAAATLVTGSPPALSLRPTGYLFTAASGGTFKLRWAQNASSATATRIRAGSFIRLVKVL